MSTISIPSYRHRNGPTQWAKIAGEIRDNIERMRREREAYADALPLLHAPSRLESAIACSRRAA